MDFDRLRYFVVLSDSDTMREASEHLCISQPALSKAMKLLEQELGEQLLISVGRRVFITDRGKLIAEKAKKVLLDVKSLTQETSREDKKKIKIGSFETFTTYFIGHFASKNLTDYQIEIRELIPGRLEDQIVAGHIDFGITYLPIPRQELDFIKVANIEMGIYGRGRFSEESDRQTLPFVVPIAPIQDSPHRVKGLDGWPANGFSRRVKYKVALMETALEFCRQEVAVAYLPKFVVELHNKQVKSKYKLQCISCPQGLSRFSQTVYLIKRKSQAEHPIFRAIAKTLQQLSKFSRV